MLPMPGLFQERLGGENTVFSQELSAQDALPSTLLQVLPE